MKRRRFFQTLAAAPAASTLLAQQAPQRAAGSAEETSIETALPAEAGEPVLSFLNTDQFAAIRRLSGILMPPRSGAPGANECRVPEFLDFLVNASLPIRQQVYRVGLDALNAESRKRHQKPFAEISDTQAADLLAPLRRPWTYDSPKDPLARFLVDAKADVHTATVNSREYSAAGAGGGGRRMGGQGLYWNPLE
jgi:hypothetical protein